MTGSTNTVAALFGLHHLVGGRDHSPHLGALLPIISDISIHVCRYHPILPNIGANTASTESTIV